MRISDWSSDVFSSDLDRVVVGLAGATVVEGGLAIGLDHPGAVDRLRVEVLEHLLEGRVLAGLLLLVPVGPVEDGRGEAGGGPGGRPALRLGSSDRRLADVDLAVAGYVPAAPRAVDECPEEAREG